MHKLDITLVTVTSVLFRMLKASATDFGSEIYRDFVAWSTNGEENDIYLQLRAH